MTGIAKPVLQVWRCVWLLLSLFVPGNGFKVLCNDLLFGVELLGSLKTGCGWLLVAMVAS